MKIITIEGNIGSGKSTLIKHLEPFLKNKGYDVVVVGEPLNQWQKCIALNGKSHFENYYENPKENAFSFQSLCMMTRMACLNSAIEKYQNCTNVILICERSIDSGNRVFGEMLVRDGFLTRSEQALLLECQTILDRFKEFEQFVLFIDTPHVLCFDRAVLRNRSGESEIDLDYFEKLEKFYKIIKRNVNIDGAQNVDEMVKDAQNKLMKCFLC